MEEIVLNPPAILALEDGSVFKGISVGAEGTSVGELVFNTAATGYQEFLTDSSSAGKLLAFTTSHLGNTGINAEDAESAKPQAAGLILRNLPLITSNFRSQQSLSAYLRQAGTVAISEVDTRRLTRLISTKGSMRACILAGSAANNAEAAAQALAQAQQAQGLENSYLVPQASCTEAYSFNEGVWQLGTGFSAAPAEPKFKVVVFDLGVKRNFLRQLVSLGCTVKVMPASSSAAEILAEQPQGIFVSNGGGDPRACTAEIATLTELVNSNVPIFAVGLGFQLLGLAMGAEVTKLPFGHHGANHPVQNLATQKIMLTTQNTNFSVTNLSPSLVATHKSLFDNGIQGLEVNGKPVIGFQGLPTGSTEPQGSASWFVRFIELMQQHTSAA